MTTSQKLGMEKINYRLREVLNKILAHPEDIDIVRENILYCHDLVSDLLDYLEACYRTTYAD